MYSHTLYNSSSSSSKFTKSSFCYYYFLFEKMDPNQLNSFFNYLQNFPQIPNTQQSQTSNSQVPNQNFTLPNSFQNSNPQNFPNFNFQTPYNNQFPIFQPQNQNSQTPHFPFSSIFNPSIGNVTPTSLPFPTQFSASRHNSSGVGGSSNPSSQTPIWSVASTLCNYTWSSSFFGKRRSLPT